ncbi:MAG TPA: hypothetical protein VL093_04695 [Flavipsychrobacter sp.]|nr:hypothetical protein [Flavipsychrobacter sp.]
MDKKQDANKDTEVTRSQKREDLQDANTSNTEKRPAGAEEKANPDHHHGSHKEGEYPRQSDDPTMHPSGADEEK